LVKSGKSSTVARVGTASPETGNDGIIDVNLVLYVKIFESVGRQDFDKAPDAMKSEPIAAC
jgi:hypothetical protein